MFNALAVVAMLVALTKHDGLVLDATLRHYMARETASGARDEALSRLHSRCVFLVFPKSEDCSPPLREYLPGTTGKSYQYWQLLQIHHTCTVYCPWTTTLLGTFTSTGNCYEPTLADSRLTLFFQSQLQHRPASPEFHYCRPRFPRCPGTIEVRFVPRCYSHCDVTRLPNTAAKHAGTDFPRRRRGGNSGRLRRRRAARVGQSCTKRREFLREPG